jgi:hypothetical protein
VSIFSKIFICIHLYNTVLGNLGITITDEFGAVLLAAVHYRIFDSNLSRLYQVHIHSSRLFYPTGHDFQEGKNATGKFIAAPRTRIRQAAPYKVDALHR